MTRAIIIGAGIIGCASAWRLAERGVEVIVLERDRVGETAASTAAAGMLGAQIEAHPIAAMQQLCVASRDRFVDFVGALTESTDTRVELRQSGALRVAYDAAALRALAADVQLQRSRGLVAELVSADDVARMEPHLAPVVGAAHFVADGVVEPRTLLETTRQAAEVAGARFEEQCEVRALSFDAQGAVDGVVLAEGRRSADVVVLAAGSWSTRIEGVERVLRHHTVEPVRGQMLELSTPPVAQGSTVLQRVIEGPSAYLSPRRDGRILVGSTMERVGFERAVTLGAVARLTAEALRMVPALERAQLRRTWCGFRAATPDGLPIFGRRRGVVVATGHFRNGIVLAPISAEIVSALVMGDTPPVDIARFGLDRLDEGEGDHGHVS